jgi:D-3-phosphoglycerate dehydrogenase
MQVAKAAAGFLRMEVVAYDPYKKESPLGVKLVPDIREVYRKADFITLHTPLTKETENLIDTSALALMKPTAYLINAGRGELVNDQTLVDALQKGKIAGAVLDVFREEPPSLTSPLFNAPNILLTPHIAGATDEAVERLAISSAQAVADLFCGKKPANIVNSQVWEKLMK